MSAIPLRGRSLLDAIDAEIAHVESTFNIPAGNLRAARAGAAEMVAGLELLAAGHYRERDRTVICGLDGGAVADFAKRLIGVSP